MSATLEVRDLRKQFASGRPAVDGVSFEVPAGEIVVLLGPSGCGKTTTLRCVAGLEHPTSGSISIGERVVSAPTEGVMVPPRLRDIGMVFQSYAVWPHMTVRQNVAYPLKHRGEARAEIDRKVDDTLELVGLSEYASRPVVSLSGGQMQRVALARSMVYRPKLILLDEPLSNLDAKLRLCHRPRPPRPPPQPEPRNPIGEPRPHINTEAFIDTLRLEVPWRSVGAGKVICTHVLCGAQGGGAT